MSVFLAAAVLLLGVKSPACSQTGAERDGPATFHEVDFKSYSSGSCSPGRVVGLASGTLPAGEWVVLELIQDGVVQPLGGVNPDASIVDNAIVLEIAVDASADGGMAADAESAEGSVNYGLIHRGDGFGIYGGTPYDDEVVSGDFDISLWETHAGSRCAAASGTLTFAQKVPVELMSFKITDE